MAKLGSWKLHISPKVIKMGSLIAHRIDYNGVAALRGQRHIPSKNKPKYPALVFCSKLGVIRAEESAFNMFATRTGGSWGERVDGFCDI